MKKILTCLLALFGLTTACGQQNYENTDVKGFVELIKDSNVVVLDVRTADEFKEGHLEGAVNIDQAQGDFIQKAKAVLPKEKTAGRLADEGYKCVNLKGGIIAWKEANEPVTIGQ